jgi:hypothetical protein
MSLWVQPDVSFSFTVQSRQRDVIHTTQDLIVSQFATSLHFWRIIDSHCEAKHELLIISRSCLDKFA